MKDNKEFDFNKHYGDEQETPPAFFWDDIEKQLPKKRKKRAAIFWISGIATIAASILLATWGVNYYNTTTDNEITTTATKQVDSEIKEPAIAQKENSTEKGINQQQLQAIDNNEAANSSSQEIQTNKSTLVKKAEKGNTDNTKNTSNIRLFSQDKSKETTLPLKQEKETLKEIAPKEVAPKQPIEIIELATANIVGEKWVAIETPKKDTTQKADDDEENKKKCKFSPSIYVALSGFAHTHTFSNYNSGISIGLGTIHKIGKNWETRIGLNYTKINRPGLQRTSTREHYFVTKTTTTQQLDITALHYLSASAKLYYNYKSLHFYGGLEALALISSRANLQTTEIKYSEERVTNQNDIIGYTQGVNTFVPQLIFGVGKTITNRVRAELQFSHSLTAYGNQSIFTDNSKIKLSYVGVGINWRIN